MSPEVIAMSLEGSMSIGLSFKASLMKPLQVRMFGKQEVKIRNITSLSSLKILKALEFIMTLGKVHSN